MANLKQSDNILALLKTLTRITNIPTLLALKYGLNVMSKHAINSYSYPKAARQVLVVPDYVPGSYHPMSS